MNREIKFRGFQKSWIYGGITIFENQANIFDVNCVANSSYEVDINSVGQFTGLKDKNGKEIYEGDVLAFDKLSFLGYKCVRFISDTASFSIANISDFKFENNWDIWQRLTSKYISDFKFEIIGNIYENPELLN